MLDPLVTAVYFLLGWIVLSLCAIIQPETASCPTGWYVDGVRPNGATSCQRPPAQGVCDTRNGCDNPEQRHSIPMRIYCTGGAHPVVNTQTGQTVGCQR